ncbi:hypothetical protein B0H13DRAFT_2346273 [Mycena leptocephala]|nr:hypothetical protein B0H13DRAFT_2346273 [Mycena leptocephala]
MSHHNDIFVSNPILIASAWTNVSFYAMELLVIGLYIWRSGKPRLHKSLVACLGLCDSICTTVICVRAYMPALIPRETIPATVFATYATALIEHAFLCRFLFTLQVSSYLTVPPNVHPNRTRIRILCAFFTFLITTHVSFSLIFGILRGLEGSHPSSLAMIFGGVAAFVCVGTDVLLTIGVATVCLRILRTWNNVQLARESFVWRVLIVTLTCGTLVWGNALLIITLYLLDLPSGSALL